MWPSRLFFGVKSWVGYPTMGVRFGCPPGGTPPTFDTRTLAGVGWGYHPSLGVPPPTNYTRVPAHCRCHELGGYPSQGGTPQLGRDPKVTKKWQTNRTLRSRRQERPRSSNPAHSKALGVTKRSSASDFLRGPTLKSPSRARSNCAPEPSRPTHDGEELTFDGEARVQRKSYFRWGRGGSVFSSCPPTPYRPH